MAFKAATLRKLAITHMVFGSLMFVFGVISAIAVHHWSSFAGFGIWIGAWVGITGVLGYVGARREPFPNKCWIGTFMGFSIMACVLTSSMVICYPVALSEFVERLGCLNDSTFKRYYICGRVDQYFDRATARNGLGLGSCLLISAIVEFSVALASSIYSCTTVCCNSTQPMYQGRQPGAAYIEFSGQVTTVQAGYPEQPAMSVVPEQEDVELPRPNSVSVSPVASNHLQAVYVGSY